MLKGINRNVIVVRTDRKSRFEAVYFVLRKGAATDRSDIIKEANRIISESNGQPSSRRQRGAGKIFFLLLCGILFGAVSASAVWLLFVI